MLTFLGLFILVSGCFIRSANPETFEQIAARTYFPSQQDFPSSSYPYITGAGVRETCDHKLDPITRLACDSVKPGDTVFVVSTFLDYFFSECHPHLPPYILVTHHFYATSDDDFPGAYADYLDDDKLIAWFTHNPDRIHPKLYPMPIGIGDTSCYPGNKKGLIDLYAPRATHHKKKMYMNFTRENHSERAYVYDLFKDNPLCDVSPYKNIERYFLDLAEFAFVLSPRGNGLDCFRTWEALHMGAFPIVKSSALDPLFTDLPVIIINDWTDITYDFLTKHYQELVSRGDYRWEKLYLPYYLEQIVGLQKKYRIKN